MLLLLYLLVAALIDASTGQFIYPPPRGSNKATVCMTTGSYYTLQWTASDSNLTLMLWSNTVDGTGGYNGLNILCGVFLLKLRLFRRDTC